MRTTPTDFLLARIAEDEARASQVHLFDCVLDHIDGRDGCSCVIPARVLAECEAKRRIVGLHEMVPADQPYRGAASGCSICDYDRDYGVIGGLCETLQALALPYADHPDYRQEWKP